MTTTLKLKVTLALLLSCFILHSQTTLDIHLTDLQKRPISFAIIKYEGSTFNCNNSGFLRISNYKPGAKITIHKFGFADTTVAIASIPATHTLSLFIVLRLKPTILPEVSVSSAVIEEINPVKADFVLGYELKGEFLVELLSDDIVLVTDTENEVKFRSRPIPGAKDIVKDPYGNLHIITDKNAFKIYPDSSFIQLDTTPVDLAKLNWNIRYCDAVTDTSLFIRRYKDNNQTTAFFAISSLHSKHVNLLKEITDADRKTAVATFANETNSLNQYVESLGLSEVTASNGAELELVRRAQRMLNMLEMNYALPSYSFLKLVNDSVYLFAHDIDTMFVYDRSWNLVKSKRIDYHHLKIWDKELFVNEEKTKVYAKLIENSRSMIAEIDLQTGALKPAFTILEARFPSKIKIRNNVAYFMAKQKSRTGYTVYSQNLQLPH